MQQKADGGLKIGYFPPMPPPPNRSHPALPTSPHNACRLWKITCTSHAFHAVCTNILTTTHTQQETRKKERKKKVRKKQGRPQKLLPVRQLGLEAYPYLFAGATEG